MNILLSLYKAFKFLDADPDKVFYLESDVVLKYDIMELENFEAYYEHMIAQNHPDYLYFKIELEACRKRRLKLMKRRLKLQVGLQKMARAEAKRWFRRRPLWIVNRPTQSTPAKEEIR